MWCQLETGMCCTQRCPSKLSAMGCTARLTSHCALSSKFISSSKQHLTQLYQPPSSLSAPSGTAYSPTPKEQKQTLSPTSLAHSLTHLRCPITSRNAAPWSPTSTTGTADAQSRGTQRLSNSACAKSATHGRWQQMQR